MKPVSIKRSFFNVQIDGEYYGTLTLAHTLQTIKDTLREDLEEDDLVDITIKLVKMTTEEYEKLPEL